MRIKLLGWAIASAALLGGGVAHAQSLALNSRIFVETRVKEADGTVRTVLSPAKRAAPGQTLVVVVDYRNPAAKPASNVVVTNPLPRAMAFSSTADDSAQVSIDGGKSWGRLEEIRVTDREGVVRQATPEDVTHVRWRLSGSVPAGGSGKVSFRGVVR